ncbi:acyltransferase [Salinimonas marina]|uniref:Acyltransferase n=1 Tax=Salinimonas marina TaxID=2785918 RepID=A0A7S9HE95_9ALTE|nr:acyltransferase [Salinimonas marina]QPG06421.1 acyltransferase [Salinimonas marina]
MSQSHRLPGLDLVRVLAVYFIILSHSGLELFRGVGVPFLLALSGFLITQTLIREYKGTNNLDLKRFWRSRFLRIAPAYYAFIALAYTLDVIILGERWESNLLIFTLFHSVNYYNALFGHGSGMVAHLWTLSTMEQFYLVYPVFIYLAFKIRKPIPIILLIIALCMFWRFLIFSELINIEHKTSWLYNALDTRLDSLLIGSLAAFYIQKLPYNKLTAPVYIWPLLLVVSVYASNSMQDIPELRYTIGYSLEGILAVVSMLSIMKISEYRIFNFVNGHLITSLAKISYPMYLYHPIGLGVGFKFFDNYLFSLTAGSITTLILAFLSYKVIEKPFMIYRARITMREKI